jgi:hypothetical protein
LAAQPFLLCPSSPNSVSTRPKTDNVQVWAHPFVPLSANKKKAHTGFEVKLMVAAASVWKKKCNDLKAKRNSLFDAYEKEPQNFHLAREIKAIDDEIAECTQHVERERRAERAAAPAAKLVTSPR